jgi:internalin A
VPATAGLDIRQASVVWRTVLLGRWRLGKGGKLEQQPHPDAGKLTKLDRLRHLQALQDLDLSGTGVKNLAPIAGLRELQSLDLSNTPVQDLSPLAQLRKLQTLILSRSAVTDVSPLKGLRALQTLVFFGADLTDLRSLAGLEGLQNLHLSELQAGDLSALAGLRCLQELGLSGTAVRDISPLAGLYGLQHLQLQGTSVEDISPLRGLQALRHLNLSGARMVDVSTVAALVNLESLDLSHTLVTHLPTLDGLQKLQTVNLQATAVADLSCLAGLKELAMLVLSDTALADLSMVEAHDKIEYLDVADTHVADISPLAVLRRLQTLHLNGTRVADLSPLAGLRQIGSLRLDETPVADLVPLAALRQLWDLSLDGTRITDLSPLADLKRLRYLSLANTAVSDLSPLDGLSVLLWLNLFGIRPAVPAAALRAIAVRRSLKRLVVKEAAGVPREVLSENPHMDCLLQVRAYLDELDHGREVDNEVKIVLLGNGRVGKTQLCRRLRGQPFDETIESTHGVQIWRDDLRIRTRERKLAVRVNWWDFGGQDIYHGTRALFLRSRAVFLILWTTELDNSDEYSVAGVPARNQPLPYWLNYVQSLAGTDSAVIVVQSQCDEYDDRRACPARPDGFWFFESCSYSAKADLGREVLEAQLADAMRYLTGDRISAFLRRLTRADLVVAVVSDKYLRSPYCLYEIYKLWQRCQGDADDLVRRVVPILLPEVRLSNLEERAPYLEFWATRADKLEALFRNPGISPSWESWQEVKLVREFAHHVDSILVFLGDVLMPRQLNVHLDSGFQAVRQALRQRIGAG